MHGLCGPRRTRCRGDRLQAAVATVADALSALEHQAFDVALVDLHLECSCAGSRTSHETSGLHHEPAARRDASWWNRAGESLQERSPRANGARQLRASITHTASRRLAARPRLSQPPQGAPCAD